MYFQIIYNIRSTNLNCYNFVFQFSETVNINRFPLFNVLHDSINNRFKMLFIKKTKQNSSNPCFLNYNTNYPYRNKIAIIKRNN